MEKNELIIGSHVKMAAPNYLQGSVNEAISNGSNAMMFYTGAPQNTRRTAIEKLKVQEMWEIWNENEMQNMVVHAPYIINLANTIEPSKAEFGVRFLVEELKRVDQIGAKVVVLHPGSHVKGGESAGLDSIVSNLNLVFEQTSNLDVKIALETMSGKGTELCYKFEQLKYIIDNCSYKNRLAICFDTCHVFDSGYDLINNFDQVIADFEKNNLLEYLEVIHLNDSKNILGSKKDRHENIGFGNIGFDTLLKIAYFSKFKNVPKILETPYIEKKFPPYKEEINMLKNKKFNSNLIDNILKISKI